MLTPKEEAIIRRHTLWSKPATLKHAQRWQKRAPVEPPWIEYRSSAYTLNVVEFERKCRRLHRVHGQPNGIEEVVHVRPGFLVSKPPALAASGCCYEDARYPSCKAGPT